MVTVKLSSFGVGVQVATRANVLVIHDGNENEVTLAVVMVGEDEGKVVDVSDSNEREVYLVALLRGLHLQNHT